MKRLLKAFLGPHVWEKLGQARQEYNWKKLNDFAQPELRPYIHQLLNFQDGFYVEIGANDGRSFSNTYRLEHSLNWSGILVEPILHKHFESKKYRSTNQNIFIYGACVSSSYDSDVLKLYYSNLMTTPVSSKDEEAELWATNGQKFLQENEEALPIWAPALTLSSVFSSHNVTKVDFLSIDVEGGELDVLEGIDWGNIQIDLILIETQVNSPSIKLLKSLGYDHIVDLGQNHFLKSKNIM